MIRISSLTLPALAVVALAFAGCEKPADAPKGTPAAKAAPSAAKSAAPSAAAKSAAPSAAASAAGSDAHAGHDHGKMAAAGPTGASKGAPADASVHFVEPADGAKVGPELKVVFGVKNMTVIKAGEAIADNTHGHHHLIIDGKPMPQGQMVPKDDTHIHYGGGQTEAQITLTPGKHTLTMQFADGAHMSYGPAMSSTITVEVAP